MVDLVKTYALMKRSEEEGDPLQLVAGVTVRPHVKYLGVLLGNVVIAQAYVPLR